MQTFSSFSLLTSLGAQDASPKKGEWVHWWPTPPKPWSPLSPLPLVCATVSVTPVNKDQLLGVESRLYQGWQRFLVILKKLNNTPDWPWVLYSVVSWMPTKACVHSSHCLHSRLLHACSILLGAVLNSKHDFWKQLRRYKTSNYSESKERGLGTAPAAKSITKEMLGWEDRRTTLYKITQVTLNIILKKSQK